MSFFGKEICWAVLLYVAKANLFHKERGGMLRWLFLRTGGPWNGGRKEKI